MSLINCLCCSLVLSKCFQNSNWILLGYRLGKSFISSKNLFNIIRSCPSVSIFKYLICWTLCSFIIVKSVLTLQSCVVYKSSGDILNLLILLSFNNKSCNVCLPIELHPFAQLGSLYFIIFSGGI